MSEVDYLKSPCSICGSNIEFPASLVGQSIDCPHCGKQIVLAAPQKAVSETSTDTKEEAEEDEDAEDRPRFGLKKVVAFIVVVLVILWPLAKRYVFRKTAGALVRQLWAENIEVTKYELVKADKGGLIHVVGSATNHGPSQYFSLKVEFELQDETGAIVGSASDQLKSLPSHGSWDVKALVLEKKAAKAKLTNLTAEKE
jgi:DNA-directed RNA polymerase subunit RPC12/RpoP